MQIKKRICVICGLLFFAVINSETKSHSETPLARLVWPVGRSDKPESGIINVRLRIGKVCVVRRVERLRAELQPDALRQAKSAIDTQVGLEKAGTTQSIPPHRSKARAGLRHPGTIRSAVYSEHCVIEPWSSTGTALRNRSDTAQYVD